ncbi:hypothetical protein O5286_22665 [Escherichia coli]|nr:hypothetical protein [Escherichia coli]
MTIFSCIPHSRHTKALCWIYGTLSRGWRICNDCRVCRLIWKLYPVSSQESDILITRKQDKYWRLGFSLDDSGTRSTGRYLGGITFSLDNPFS